VRVHSQSMHANSWLRLYMGTTTRATTVCDFVGPRTCMQLQATVSQFVISSKFTVKRVTSHKSQVTSHKSQVALVSHKRGAQAHCQHSPSPTRLLVVKHGETPAQNSVICVRLKSVLFMWFVFGGARCNVSGWVNTESVSQSSNR
jgi:hypothetical protein